MFFYSDCLYWIMVTFVLLIMVAFFTMIERKIIGLIQNRIGPNKTFMLAMMQPINDAMKLVLKEMYMFSYNLSSSTLYLHMWSPMMACYLFLFMWGMSMSMTGSIIILSSVILFVCITNSAVFPIFVMSWFSNSKYSLIGSVRSICQSISYEVTLSFFLVSILYMYSSFELMEYSSYQYLISSMLFIPLMIYFWFIILMAESSRSPFDLMEGESELVSGFNVEYSSGIFSFLFLAEYGFLLFLSFLMVKMGLGGNLFLVMNVDVLKFALVLFMPIWLRSTLPRVRYDQLMMLSWQVLLPISMGMGVMTLSFFFM